jgi:hypothetical protein
MKTVMFAFKSEVPLARVNELILDIAMWKEAKAAGQLKPGGDGRVGRMAYVRLKDEASVEAVVARLKQLPEVEYAEPPAERHLQG